jgi:hypothetical protein
MHSSTCGTKAVKQPIELMMAPLAFSKPGKLVLSHTPHTSMAMPKNDKARAEMILVKNQTSFWTVVNLNFLSPDMATMRPITDLSPMANTTPVQEPWTTNVDVNAMLRVSRALSEVASTTPGIMALRCEQNISRMDYTLSDSAHLSPVRSDRSNLRSVDTSTSLRSAGTRSPMERETRSPTTTFAAGIV